MEALIFFTMGAVSATSLCWYLWHADAKEKQAIADELDALKAKFVNLRGKG